MHMIHSDTINDINIFQTLKSQVIKKPHKFPTEIKSEINEGCKDFPIKLSSYSYQ